LCEIEEWRAGRPRTGGDWRAGDGVDFRISCRYNVAETGGRVLNAERKVSYDNPARQEIHDPV